MSFTVVVVAMPQVAEALRRSGQFARIEHVGSTGGLRDLLQSQTLTSGTADKVFLFSDATPVDTVQSLELLVQRMTATGARVVVVATSPAGEALVQANPGAGLLKGQLRVNSVMGALTGMDVTAVRAGQPVPVTPVPDEENLVLDPSVTAPALVAPTAPAAPAPAVDGNPFGAPAGNPFGAVEPAAPVVDGNPFGAPATPPPAPAAPAPAPAPAAPAADSNPFGAPATPSSSANPFGAPAGDSNPFGASVSPAAPAQAPAPVVDGAFGAPAAPATPAADNPFGAPAAPAAQVAVDNPFGAPAAPAAPGNPFGTAPAAPGSPFGAPPAAPVADGSPFGSSAGFGSHVSAPAPRAGVTVPDAAPKRLGYVITVTAPKGGTGKSSLSLNLAAYLGLRLQGTGKNVALIDANVQQADAGKYLNAFSPNIEDIAKDPTAISPDRIGDYLLHRRELNLSALLGPMSPDAANPVYYTGKRYTEILKAMKPNFDYIIIDTPVAEFYHDIFRVFALPNADFVLVAITPNYTTLINTDSWLRQVCSPVQSNGMGLDPNKVGVVLNRAEDEIGFTEDEVIRDLNQWRYLGAVPETKEWKKCNNDGKLVATYNYHELNVAFSNILYQATGEEILKITPVNLAGTGGGIADKLRGWLKKGK